MSTSTQDLVVRIATKVDNSANSGLKQLADQSKKIAAETQSAFDRAARSDPFSKLARGGELTDRLGKTVKQLQEVGSGFSMVREQVKGFFGISGQSKAVERSLGMIRDRVESIRASASRMRIDGDISPILMKIKRVDGEVRKIRSAAGAMMTTGIGQFGAAGGGIMDITRGTAMLAAGEGLDKIATAMLSFDASVMVFRGSRVAFQNIVGGIANTANSLAAMGAAGKLSKELGGIIGQTGGMASLFGGFRARHAIGAIGGSFLGAALGGDWLGAGIGGVAGMAAAHFAPSILKSSLLAATGIPLLGAAALGSYAFYNSPGLQKMAAPLASHIPNWVPQFRFDSLPESRRSGTDGNLDLHMLNLDASNAARERAIQGARHDASDFASFGLTSHDLAQREHRAAIFQAQEQISDLSRNFDLNYHGTLAGAREQNWGMVHERALGRQSTAFSEAVQNTQRFDAGADTFARAREQSDELSRLAGIGGVGSASVRGRVAGAQRQLSILQEEAELRTSQAGTLRTNLAQSQELKARRDELLRTLNGENRDTERAQLLRMRDRTLDVEGRNAIEIRLHGIGMTNAGRAPMQAELNRVSNQLERIGSVNTDDVKEAEDRRAAAVQRVADAQQRLNSLKAEEKDMAMQTLATEQKRFQDTSTFFRDQARALRDQQREQAGSFGLRDENDAARALGIGRQLTRGETPSREDIDFARSVPALAGPLADLGRQNDRGVTAMLGNVAFPGGMSTNERIAMNDREANRNQEAAVRIENQLRIQAEINVESMARDLTRDLLPAVQNVQSAVAATLRIALQEINRRVDQQARQQNGANSPPGPEHH